MILFKISKNQFIRYIFIAGINVMVGYVVFAFLIFLGLHYILASTLSTIFSIIFSFKTFSRLVFDNKNNLLMLRYLIVWAIVYFLNIAGLVVLNYFKISNYISGFILMFPLAGLGFLLNRNFVFKQANLIISAKNDKVL